MSRPKRNLRISSPQKNQKKKREKKKTRESWKAEKTEKWGWRDRMYIKWAEKSFLQLRGSDLNLSKTLKFVVYKLPDLIPVRRSLGKSAKFFYFFLSVCKFYVHSANAFCGQERNNKNGKIANYYSHLFFYYIYILICWVFDFWCPWSMEN
jgi:hypothetical protein